MALASTPVRASERFALEFSKSVIYVGESVQANFVLYAREDALDVEVARFPQFRGFWSENTGLHQGPTLMLRQNFQQELRRAVIGTYVITPMQGRDQHTIEPMKVLVKRMLGGARDTIALPFESEKSPLEIKPLPALPTQWSDADRKAWKGLVGTVALRADSDSARFYSGEPTTIRYSIQGDANFAELRELPIPAPPEVSVLDQRVSLFGSGPLATKIFEVTLVPRTEKDVQIPPLRLPVFDPSTGSYDILATDPVLLVREPKPLFAQGATPTEGIAKETTWRLVRPAWRSPGFLAIQAALAAGLLTLGGLEIRRRRKAARHNDPAYRRTVAVQNALACLDRGDRDGFFRAIVPVAQASQSEPAVRLLAHREALLFGPPGQRPNVLEADLRSATESLAREG